MRILSKTTVSRQQGTRLCCETKCNHFIWIRDDTSLSDFSVGWDVHEHYIRGEQQPRKEFGVWISVQEPRADKSSGNFCWMPWDVYEALISAHDELLAKKREFEAQSATREGT